MGYRDYNDGPERFTILPFTRSISTIKKFISSVHAKSTGRTDTPEDVLGGLRQALQLNWRAQRRAIVLLGDAPCHGRRFYEARDHEGRTIDPKKFDFYPDGDPDNSNAQQLIEEIADSSITFIGCCIPNQRGAVITHVMMNAFRKMCVTLSHYSH